MFLLKQLFAIAKIVTPINEDLGVVQGTLRKIVQGHFGIR